MAVLKVYVTHSVGLASSSTMLVPSLLYVDLDNYNQEWVNSQQCSF